MHKCRAGSADDRCAVCGQDEMRLSTKNISILPCGHALHYECRMQLERHGDEKGNVTCPTCRRSIRRDRDHEDFMVHMIRNTPMPDELRHIRVVIVCNDCLTRSVEPYHFYGAVCANEACRSVNTSSLRTIADANEVVEMPPQRPRLQQVAAQEAQRGAEP